jgi:hypothetical protein
MAISRLEKNRILLLNHLDVWSFWIQEPKWGQCFIISFPNVPFKMAPSQGPPMLSLFRGLFSACWGSLPRDCGGVFTSATRLKLICPWFWGPYRIRASMGESYLVWLGTKSSWCGQESSNYGVSECKESPDFVDLLRQHSLMALGHSVEHSSQSAPLVGWQDDNKGIKEDQLQVIFLAKFRSPTAYKHEN